MINYINPSFSLFGLEIHWYAVCILIGVILAVIAGVREGKKIGIPSDYIYTGVVIVLPCSILGARIWWDIFNADKIHSFTDIFAVWDGGLAIQGGVLAALLTIYLYCRVRKFSFYRILDVVAPGFLIGQICGRWGNFCNHELYGPVVKNVQVFKNLLPSFITENMYIAGEYRHPTFLYESLLNLVGLVLMLVARRKFKKLESGDLIGGYLVWYGLVRIPIELLRSNSGANEILMAGPVPMSILISIIFIVCGIALLVAKRFVGPRVNYHELMKTIKENRYDTVLFDLDGTLLNTRELINRSFVHTFEHFRPEKVLTDEELDSFFGPSLRQTFSRYSEDEKEIEEMVKYYREYNVAMHDEVVTAFPGAKSLIKTLARKGYKVGVVSSKKTDLVEHGLELFGMLDNVRVVIGEEDVKNPKPDPEGILRAMEMLHSKKALYVGDGVGDIEAGKNAGIDTVGVLYSDRKEQIIAAEPTYTIRSLNDMITILVE
ncbi:MAG: prolipoprotein diacylglyceryl transferase [Anaeroplasmataceae bacterium]|nr:prolipoprotein diacylglyceryl transferase [Anaeroplasmataceae bacterium]MDE6414731.1 prolipoprotein diacylglyceryl transferase [Anaeroplasmataceae bacterium]